MKNIWYNRTYLNCIVLSLVIFIYPTPGDTSPAAAKEYQIKAVFLLNFANFVAWPESAFEDKNSLFQICIFGVDPFGVFLDLSTEGQTTRDGRTIRVSRIQDNLQEIRACHIVFISDSEQNNLRIIFERISDLPILTVSDIDQFVKRGGMIEFFNRGSRIRLGINPDAVREKSLIANANLLNLSQIIRP